MDQLWKKMWILVCNAMRRVAHDIIGEKEIKAVG
jgi:hypothetical protein